MKFIKLIKPLAYDVKCNTKVVIPAGALGVKIAFRASHLRRYDEDLKKWVPMNVYIWHGKMYHA